ncbi:hypothetical protein EV401DRAFT_1892959 [Pisolithus croceorrhizus]|nr:hypothetical protein EV401DRAFT_1892959 [Pisolithus croceorrhizus]
MGDFMKLICSLAKYTRVHKCARTIECIATTFYKEQKHLGWCAGGKQMRVPEVDGADDPTTWILQLTVVDVFTSTTISGTEKIGFATKPYDNFVASALLIANVDSLVDKVLHRNSPNWHLKHCCLACTYTLEGEQPLQFSILYALDGSDSLKRIQCKLLSRDSKGWSTSIELPMCQYAGQDSVSLVWNEDSEVNPCASHWKNMDDQKTKKTWGVYDKTGIMLAVLDMVQSGELAKYPLTIISKLLEVFGKDLGGGYDIGCQFKTTLNQSPLGLLACSLNHTCLVGAFHGHAHQCLCQLDHLTTYTKGLGLEDLETLYANLSKFLYDNYKQALDTICLMKEQDMSNEQVFEKWLAEEKAYLEQLSHKPPEEMLQMEYWEQLIKLTASK